MNPKRILVLGGGFAGLWAAAGAARKLDELGVGPQEVAVTLVNRDPYHSIRVRNYEADLTPTRVPLCEVLDPIGVTFVEGEVRGFDFADRQARVATAVGETSLPYDRLVVALGSRLVRPALPGLAEFSFDVDTYHGAMKLNAHLASLADEPDGGTVLIVGAGLTGIELAAEMPGRLRALQSKANIADGKLRVILADHSDHLGSTMGPFAQPVIAEALAALGVETRVGVRVARIDRAGATLDTGEDISARTVVWCAGMQADPLTQLFPVERDRWGRLPVDQFLRVSGMPGIFPTVQALTVLPNGDLVAGGQFPIAGGIAADRIARWNGSTWSALGSGMNNTVLALTMLPNGDLAAGGDFTTAGGSVSASVARYVSTCPATVVATGTACPGSGGPNTYTAINLPWIGTTFRARSTTIPSFALVVVATGSTTTSIPLANLLPLSPPACNLQVTPDLHEWNRTVSSAGIIDTQLAIPGSVALAGLQLHQQLILLEVDQNLVVLESTSSNALTLTIGAF